MPKTLDSLSNYPGDVNTPLKLVLPANFTPTLGAYGDIITFPAVDGVPQRDARGFTIHPEQKFILVRAEAASGSA